MYNQIKKKILVLDGNSSQCLPLIRNLFRDGYWVTLVCPGIYTSGYFSRYVSKKMIWPGISDNETEFYKRFLDHIKSEKYEFVLSLSDVSTRMLAFNKDEVEKYVKTLVPEYDVYSVAADKYLTMRLCMENQIPCPITFSDSDIDSKLLKDSSNYPVVVKPRRGVGAIGFTIIPDRDSLIKQLPSLKKDYGSLVIQEYIPNQIQYTAEVFCDKDHVLKMCVISEKKRFFPVKGGTSSCNVTIENPEIDLISEKLLKKLKWIGVANIDFVLDPRDNIPKVLEINPRIGATAKIAFAAGIDLVQMLLKLANDSYIKRISDYKKGIIMRNLLLDALWFFFSSFKDKRKTKPPFLKLFGRNVYYQSSAFDDPLPIIGFFLGYIVKYSNMNKLKNKLGFYKRSKIYE